MTPLEILCYTREESVFLSSNIVKNPKALSLYLKLLAFTIRRIVNLHFDLKVITVSIKGNYEEVYSQWTFLAQTYLVT